MPRRKTRYFVMNLAGTELEHKEKSFEIQILDLKGRAREKGYAGNSETELVIGEHRIPLAVLSAARRQTPGIGDYVDETGTSMHPLLWVPRALGD